MRARPPVDSSLTPVTDMPITVNSIDGAHIVFTESGENDSIQHQLIRPPTRGSRGDLGRWNARQWCDLFELRPGEPFEGLLRRYLRAVKSAGLLREVHRR